MTTSKLTDANYLFGPLTSEEIRGSYIGYISKRTSICEIREKVEGASVVERVKLLIKK